MSAPLRKPSAVVAPETVEATIAAFTRLDLSGDRRSMNKMAQRLGKEQPAMLQFAARARDAHGERTGEATVFYGSLVWAMFDRHVGTAPRLLPGNLEEAEKVVAAEMERAGDQSARPRHARTAEALTARQPHLYAKLIELVAEDVREAAITAETAAVVFPAAQVIVEAFDAAIEGRRPGERIGPVVRDAAKVGRNDPCPCGSGQKYKKCCGTVTL